MTLDGLVHQGRQGTEGGFLQAVELLAQGRFHRAQAVKECAQRAQLRRRGLPGGWLDHGTLASQHHTIPRVGLGAYGEPLDEIPELGGVDDGHPSAGGH